MAVAREIQFARLLAEVRAVGLTADQMKGLSVSMDLPEKEIADLFAEAEDVFEAAKPPRDKENS